MFEKSRVQFLFMIPLNFKWMIENLNLRIFLKYIDAGWFSNTLILNSIWGKFLEIIFHIIFGKKYLKSSTQYTTNFGKYFFFIFFGKVHPKFLFQFPQNFRKNISTNFSEKLIPNFWFSFPPIFGKKAWLFYPKIWEKKRDAVRIGILLSLSHLVRDKR